MSTTNQGCTNVIRIPQFTGTCWFNALLYSIFYSDGMRAVLKQHIKTWNMSTPSKLQHEDPKNLSDKTRLLGHMYSIFEEILMNQYELTTLTDEDARYFQKVTPDYLLKTLHDYRPGIFDHNNEILEGGIGASYYQHFLNFLNVKNILSYYSNIDSCGNLSFFKDTRIHVTPNEFVDVVLYHVGTSTLGNQNVEYNLEPHKKITIGDQTFVLDSVLLTNQNIHELQRGHEITGITCKGKRYVYNGWTFNTQDSARGKGTPLQNSFNSVTRGGNLNVTNPCELFEFDWASNSGDFCLADAKCKIYKKTDTTPLPRTRNELCFNFSKGPRLLVYVNEQYINNPDFRRDPQWRNDIVRDNRGKIFFDETLDKKTLECVKDRSNVAHVSYPDLFDHEKFDGVTYERDPQRLQTLMDLSPKVYKLLQNVLDSMTSDKAVFGKPRKHLIYSDATSRYGAKFVATALVRAGMHCALKRSRGGRLALDLSPTAHNVLLLTGKAIYGDTITAALKKQIVSVFNDRPGNIYGEKAVILIIDGSFKEGLDVFDVRYMHILDNLMSTADRKQVIGRAQRMCGQKGLPFERGAGWKLEVFTYDIDIPFEKRLNYGMNNTTFEFYHQKHGHDRDSLEFSNLLEDVVMSGAVDFELTKAIHGRGDAFQDEIGIEKPVAVCQALFTLPPADPSVVYMVHEGQVGGKAAKNAYIQYQIEWANNPKLSVCKQRPTKSFPIYSYDLVIVLLLKPNVWDRIPDTKRNTLCTLFSSDRTMETTLKEYIKVNSKLTDSQVLTVIRNAKELRKRRKLSPSLYYLILKRLEHKIEKPRILSPDPDMTNAPYYRRHQKEIKAKYGFDYRWVSGDENDCKNEAVVPKPQNETKAKENKSSVMTLTPTQRFVKDYFSPQSDHKGMLLYHSVGTGKTATAIVTASNSFEREGYRILWVTRTSLKSDVNKNIVGPQSAHERIRDAMKSGKILPNMDSKEIRMKFLSQSWRIPPMSYKQFSNALLRRNQLGEELYRTSKNGDPLFKTLLIIDEAHKLFAEGGVTAHEKHDVNAIVNAIHASYTQSGSESVRPLLMTATPYTNNPMEFMRIVNLLFDKESERFPEAFEEFSIKFLSEGGRFTKDGRTEFLDRLAGKVSYLNRASDMRQFAQPYHVEANMPMSTFAERNAISSVKSFRLAETMLREKKQVEKSQNINILKTRNEIKEISNKLKELANNKKVLKKQILKKEPVDVQEAAKQTLQKMNPLIANLKERKMLKERMLAQTKDAQKKIKKTMNDIQIRVKSYKHHIKTPTTIEAGIQSCFQNIGEVKKTRKLSVQSDQSSQYSYESDVVD